MSFYMICFLATLIACLESGLPFDNMPNTSASQHRECRPSTAHVQLESENAFISKHIPVTQYSSQELLRIRDYGVRVAVPSNVHETIKSLGILRRRRGRRAGRNLRRHIDVIVGYRPLKSVTHRIVDTSNLSKIPMRTNRYPVSLPTFF